MGIRHAVVVAGMLGVVVASLTVTAPNAHATTARFDPAVVINGFTCGVIDGDGGFFVTDQTHTVITSSGNSVLKCHASGVPNSTGSAVNRSGFLCGTALGLTTDSHETVSASGEVDLTCKVR